MIQCPNPACQTDNAIGESVCYVCQSPLVRRFLWVVGEGGLEGAIGTVLHDRFQVWGDRILLDTQPALSLPPLTYLPPAAVPYLRLAALPLHVPRPYTALPGRGGSASLLLLEDAPLSVSLGEEGQLAVNPLPSLSSQWAQATPLRQLNWLRQIASLWTPLSQEGVQASLLVPDFVRVDGSVLRLLSLHSASENEPTLVDLGRQWQTLVPTAHPAVRAYLTTLSEQLFNGSLQALPDLVGALEQAVETLFQAQPVQIQTATYTDQGPTRSRNEDACHPPSGTTTQGLIQGSQLPTTLTPLVVVCDGIGGHESGDVASHLAIEKIQQTLSPLSQQPHLSPATVTARIQEAITIANDAISQRNDQENRQARGRMGTTLVVALMYPPYLFIAHLGDSRAYRISAQNHCQISLDDDVAARETRLGYSFYREALQSPSSGSLVQALGIGESAYLYPTVQHFLLDDDSLFLLCSDGLSDYERVDALWLSSIRPAVMGHVPLGETGQRLIMLANTYNGHDNVTVGLISLSPQAAQTFPALPATSPAERPSPPTGLSNAGTAVLEQPTVLQASDKTVLQVPTATVKRRSRKPWLGCGIGLAIALPVLAASAWWAHQILNPAQPMKSMGLGRFRSVPPFRLGESSPNEVNAVTAGSFWQVNSSTATPTSPNGAGPLTLQPVPESPDPAAVQKNAPLLPVGSILKVISRRVTPEQTSWVLLQICSLSSELSPIDAPQETDTSALPEPSTAPSPTPAPQLAQPGSEGWILEPQFTSAATVVRNITPTQQGGCP
ncbi:MAG TPA: protein phosphatase 2C domain-containing protein [Trichocoleus sp.]